MSPEDEDSMILTDDAQAISIEMEAWNMHGDHSHGIMPAP